MQFDYFYGNEAEQFTFYRIPKVLVSSPQFKKVSDSAKLLYGLMLERLIDRYNTTIIQIKKQIDYDSLVNTNDAEIINNIVNVMADVMLLDIPYYEIEGNKISTDYVRLRYSQITYGNIHC